MMDSNTVKDISKIAKSMSEIADELKKIRKLMEKKPAEPTPVINNYLKDKMDTIEELKGKLTSPPPKPRNLYFLCPVCGYVTKRDSRIVPRLCPKCGADIFVLD